MANEPQLLIANNCQIAVSALSLVACLPLWAMVWRSRSSEALSLPTWALWNLSCGLALFHALTQHRLRGDGQVLVVSSSLARVFALVTLGLIVKFRSPGRRAAWPARSTSWRSRLAGASGFVPVPEASDSGASNWIPVHANQHRTPGSARRTG